MTLLLLGAGKQTVASGGAAPLFSSAEVGTVNASTVVVTFDQDVSAADYSSGVTIKVNGSATSITSATRQANHAIVYYAIPVLWHGSGDAVTWEYSEAGGSIVSESDSTPLADVSAQSATNNCEYEALLDLQADTLALADNDPVSTWADQSGNGRDFTQSGAARPTKNTLDGYPAVVFAPAINDWLLGPDFADNTFSFSIMAIRESWSVAPLITKIGNDQCSDPGSTGWSIYGNSIAVCSNLADYSFQNSSSNPSNKSVWTFEAVDQDESHIYINSVLDDAGATYINGNGVDQFSTPEPVRIGADGSGFSCDLSPVGNLYTLLIFAQAPNATNRAALEVRLAARYGVTL